VAERLDPIDGDRPYRKSASASLWRERVKKSPAICRYVVRADLRFSAHTRRLPDGRPLGTTGSWIHSGGERSLRGRGV